MLSKKIPWSHIVSPNGWAVVKPGQVVYLNPAQPLPPHRSIELRVHNKTLSTSITLIVGLSQAPKDLSKTFTLYSAPLDKVYYIVLSRTNEAMAPLGYMSHEIAVYCETSSGTRTACDLSFLFNLAAPQETPEIAARVFRAMAVVCNNPDKEKPYVGTAVVKGKPGPACTVNQLMPPEREATWTAWVPGVDKEMAHPEWPWNMRKAFDCLADPECLAALMRLVFDRSEKARCYGAQLELWSPMPYNCGKVKAEEVVKKVASGEGEEGRFTEKARRALYVVGHWLPPHLIV